jgi:membrane-bound lytic murein transglycosylase B
MRSILAILTGVLLAAGAAAGPAPELSIHPKPRTEGAAIVLTQAKTSNLAFNRWIDRFRARARAAGIRDRDFDNAFQGVRYNTDVVQKDRNQSEFTKQIW